MNNDILQNLKDSEKLLIFNIALEQAKEKNVDFESQIGVVINAFLISKKELEGEKENYKMNMTPKEDFVSRPFEMNVAPKQDFVSRPFEMNMAPKEDFVSNQFEMNMAPKEDFVSRPIEINPRLEKKDTDDTKVSGNNDGPYLEPIDTQKINEEYRIM